ncbi:MAG: hypothetical protein EDX89_22630 [Acidobacteria bacterium]|nr:MAG: hypothetical protein EDX89_22630 [Acidobacteriota bacterium]
MSAPIVRVLPTAKVAEKGGVFQILVEITAEEPLSDVVLAPIPPDGFTVEPIPGPGVTPDPKDVSVRIPRLDARSSITVAFRVWPPNFLGRPRHAKKEAPYYARGGPKSFTINVFYSSESSGGRGSLTNRVEIPYTTSIGFYLLFGLVGLLLGHVVKTETKHRADVVESRKAASSRSGRIASTLGFVFLTRFPALLTSLVIGFGALLTMAKDAIPVASWHQAIALGIGLALLADEQLLTKVRPPG